jgi:hypothetical protein
VTDISSGHGDGACLDLTDLPSRVELLRTCLAKILDELGWSNEKRESLIAEMVQLPPAQLETQLNDMGIDICSLHKIYEVSCEDLMHEYKQRLNKIEVALSALELKNLEEKLSDKQLSAKKKQLEAIRVKLDARYKDLSEFRCPG